MVCPNPNCRRDVPPNAEFCPHCGYALIGIRPERRSNNSIIIGAIIAVALVLIAGIICYTYIQTHSGQQNALSAPTAAQQSETNDTGSTSSDTTSDSGKDSTQTVASQQNQPQQSENQPTETVNNYYYYYSGSTPANPSDDYYSNAGSSTYLWPTDSRYISRSDLSGLSRDTVAAIRNEIYARHGYAFTTARWQNYFANKTWYHRNSNVTEKTVNSYLSSLEKSNIATITSYEEAQGWR